MKNFSFCAVDVLGSETRKHNTLNLNERTFEKSFDDCNYTKFKLHQEGLPGNTRFLNLEGFTKYS